MHEYAISKKLMIMFNGNVKYFSDAAFSRFCDIHSSNIYLMPIDKL